MNDFYDSWFKRGKSNSEEAAFIFNCKDPRLDNSKFKFPAKDNDYSGVKPDTWEWEVLETYYIFESAVTADWEQCFDIEADFNFWFRHPKKTSPSHFYCLALNKGIQIPVPLKDAYLRFTLLVSVVALASSAMQTSPAPHESRDIHTRITTLDRCC